MLKILVAAPPKTGKTTLVIKLAERFRHIAGGFYTIEVTEANKRTGFEVVTLRGKRVLLASIYFKTPYRVSKYRVDIGAMDVAASELIWASQNKKIIFVDEVGKMECYSKKFVDTLKCITDRNLLMTARTPNPSFIDASIFKNAKIYFLTKSSFSSVYENICREIEQL